MEFSAYSILTWVPIPLLLLALILLWPGKSKMLTDLSRKAIFISGCDSGFGFNLAMHFKRNLGWNIIAGCYQPNSKTSGAEKLREAGVFVTQLDVTDDQSIKKAILATENYLEKNELELWCVVNNAAVLVFGEAEWQPRQMIRHQLDVNVVGVFELSKHFLPHLRKSKGRIVNMISFCTDCPLPTLSVYTATKAALRSLSAGMRMELSKFNINVILFNPGDHPKETPLCSNQGVHYAQMRKELEKVKDFEDFKDYFDQTEEWFKSLFPTSDGLSVRPLENPGFYRTFKEVVCSKHPKFEYISSDFMTTSFFKIVGWLPTKWADKARLALMRLPKYIPK